ncbi:MAG: LptF/LptG family permease, partial [Bacteroidales bacterium]|nr:LptF/LptG family permease [Bacteroidales bacterium]
IMAVIGISFAMHWEKRGGKAQGLAAGIVIGLSYWLIFAFAVSLGRAGTLPPLLAAWAANILFGLTAGVMFLRIRT